MSMMEKFADPKLFDGLSLGDKMTGALITTLMGMGITFLVLILLWGCISIMSKVINGTKKKEVAETSVPETPAAAAPVPTPQVQPVQTVPQGITVTPPITAQNSDEVIVAISVAIVAYEASK